MLEDEGKHSRAEVESRVEAFRQKNSNTDYPPRPSSKVRRIKLAEEHV